MEFHFIPIDPTAHIPIKEILTECSIYFTYFNILCFTLIASYAAFTLIKLRKMLKLANKVMVYSMTTILFLRAAGYIYLYYISDYCEETINLNKIY